MCVCVLGGADVALSEPERGLHGGERRVDGLGFQWLERGCDCLRRGFSP